jgi:hypothetical protein
MTSRRTVRVALVLALLAPGCQWMCGKKKPTVTVKDAGDALPQGVEMIGLGREPRVKLEVARWTGLGYRLQTQIDGAFGLMGMPAAKSPTSLLATHTEVVHGSADPVVQEVDGKKLELVEERAQLDRIEVQSTTLPPEAVQQLNLAFKLLEGMTTRSLTSSNGEVVSLETETVGGVVPPPEVKRVLDEILDAQRTFPFRLPPVPVGLGARWRFSAPFEVHGVKAVQVAEMTLVGLGAKSVRIGIRVRHRAPAQVVPHPIDPSIPANLDHLRGDADGEIEIDKLTACTLSARLTTTSYLTLSWTDADGHAQNATFLQANVQRMRGRVGPPDDAGADGEAGEPEMLEELGEGGPAPAEEPEGE